MNIRPYKAERDLRAIERIWYEIGWVENPEEASYIKDRLSVGSCLTACLNDSVECAVHTVPGTIRYLQQDLSMCVVTAVTTSRIARKQGFALRLTALQLLEAAKQGAQVASLGIFDQGFYDKLGFGTASYQHTLQFDPSSLLVDATFRVPARLHKDDWREVHAALCQRQMTHGGCVLEPPETTKAEIGSLANGFGLGYYQGERISHFIWCESKGEFGPCDVLYMAYRNAAELLELLALIKSLGDQFASVRMIEPAHVQLQAMLSTPFRNMRISGQSKHANTHTSIAGWQLRILDLPGCINQRCWQGAPFAFNLDLSDPLASHLADKQWQGVGGTYTVNIGESSTATPGLSEGLPLLKASVNAMTRLVFGVCNASSLQISDDFDAPADVIDQLDEAFCLPDLRPAWEF